MSSSNLKKIVQQLKSDKSKERQQALISLREAFSRKDVIDSFDPSREGKPWLIVFQSLFEAVISERKAASRKGASVSASEARLKEAASTVRWLAEKSVACWGLRVGKAIIKHLIQAMKDRGELYTPVALDCIKALRVICAFAPHLNQIMMDEDLWITILSLSFAVVLGDDINSIIDDENSANFDSSEGEVSLVLSNENDSATGRKRKRGLEGEKKVAGRTPGRTISPEQIECVSIIALLLRSRRLRLMSTCEGRLAPAVVSRMTRFFSTFKSETSAHLDAVSAIHSILDTLTMNSKEQTTNLAVALWEPILSLWSTKSRTLKEGLMMIIVEVLPFLALDGSGFNKLDGYARFLQFLQTDVTGSRPVFDELDMSNLRLNLTRRRDLPYTCNTFSAAYTLAPNHVVSWSVVKLLSDLTFELHRVVESNHSSPAKQITSDRKRSRIEDPIQAIIKNVQKAKVDRKILVLSLQVLAFLIEYHWKALHAETRSSIFEALVGSVTNDDASTQSWTFLAITSIVWVDSQLDKAVLNETSLDSLWSHSMRRTNVPVVCRAACHLSLALLQSGRLPLNRIHTEIEAMALDITVQGPSAPYDAVCHFLSQCIKVASQDTRLFRLHLDEKVVAWLIENWTSIDAASRPTRVGQASHDAFEVEDMFLLLQNACGFSHLASGFNAPTCLPIHSMVDLELKRLDRRTILDFLLNAHLPSSDTPHTQIAEVIPPSSTLDLMEPDARIRRLSAFFLKTSEGVLSNLESDSPSHLPAPNVIRLFNFTLLTFFFEIALAMSGIRNSIRMLSASSSLFKTLAPCLREVPWTHDELTQILSIFSILDAGKDASRSERAETIIDAGRRTGVRGSRETDVAVSHQSRTVFLSNVWQCSEFQEGFDAVLSSVKRILQKFAVHPPAALNSEFGSQNVDEHDGFGPVRALGTPVVDNATSHNEGRDQERVIAMCISSLSFASALRLAAGDALRDDFIVRTIVDCDDDAVVLDLLIPFTTHIRLQRVRLSSSNLDSLLDRLEEPLMSYNHGTSDVFHALAAQFLHATMPIWMDDTLPEDIHEKVKLVYEWLADHLTQGRLQWWETRDAFRRLCESVLLADPKERFFDGMETSFLPHNLLVLFVEDDDTCVRCGGALSIGYLFASDYMQSQDPMAVYTDVRERLCTTLSNYEHMLTRFLCLANILVASSVVRRGPYWHLIETCLFTHIYIKHIECVLEIATQKMGLSRFRDLFEAYATQIAYSIRLSKKDFFRLPPTLLGYGDRRECAESTFVSFSPTNLLASEQDLDDLSFETGPFAHHCALVKISVPLGLRNCFPNIVAYIIVSWIEENSSPGEGTDGTSSYMDIDDSVLLKLIHESFSKLGPLEAINQLLAESVDSVVCSVLRMCGDLDLASNGPILQALQNSRKGGKMSPAFQVLTRYQVLRVNEVHTPNLPAYDTTVIIKALDWLSGRIESAYSEHTTYHVLQQLFADISQCVVINEQLRLLTAVVVWICLNERHFYESKTLLRVLMGGATTCLGQEELCILAQGIMEWTFECICATQDEVIFLSDVLLRCSAVANIHSQSSMQAICDMGSQLHTWLEQYITQMWQIPSLRGQIVMALYAWPRECTEGLKALLKQSECRSLSAVFSQPLTSTHRLKAIRNISRVIDGAASVQDFASKEFWRLKQSIPVEGLTIEETDAFSDLLLAHGGNIRGHLAEPHSGDTIAALHLQYARNESEQAAKKSIIQAFLVRILDQARLASNTAYHTLRCLAGIEPLSSPFYGSWPSRFRGDVEYLDFCPKPQRKAVSHEGGTLLGSDFESMVPFEEWVCPFAASLCSALSDSDHFFGQISEVMKTDVELAQQALPVLVYCLLQQKKSSADDTRSVISKHLTSVITSLSTDARCHRAIVDLVTHLRNFEAPSHKDPLGSDKWLDINFVSLSRSAISCGAYTSALLFLELAEEYSQVTRDLAGVKEVIMFEIYNHIDEPDGFYGIKSSDLQNTLLRRFRHEQQWDKAFQFHGALFEFDRAQDDGSVGVVESLHAFGFHKLALSTLQSVADYRSSNSSDLTYKLGWRTDTWDLPNDKAHGSSSASLYSALRAVHRSLNMQSATSAVAVSMSEEMQRLRALGNENLFEIRQVTQNLMCLAQIRRWQAHSISKLVTSGPSEKQLAEVRDFFSLSRDFRFTDVETIIATRVSLLHGARQRDEREQIGTSLSSETQRLLQYEKLCFLQLAEAARLAHQPQVALNSVIRLLKLDSHPSFETQQELSRVLWLQQEQKTAVASLQKEVRKRKSHILASNNVAAKVQLALALSQLGEWTTEACLEKAKFIGEEYFSPAIELLGGKSENIGINERRAEVYYKYALFSEKQYHELLSSDDIRRLTIYQDLKSEEIAERAQQLKNATSNTQKRELMLAQSRAMQLQKQDTAQLEEFGTARQTYLHRAFEMFANTLKMSDSFDTDAAIRFCSLWFANFGGDNSVIGPAVKSIPSRKLIFLAHQLSARLSAIDDDEASSQAILQQLLYRMCVEHPFHSLYQVYLLQSSYSTSSRRQSSQVQPETSQMERAGAASSLFDRLLSTNNSQKARDVKYLCDAYLQWAKYPIKNNPEFQKRKRGDLIIPKALEIRKVDNVKVPVATARLPLDPTMQYEDCVWVAGYLDKFETAGGINVPKICFCKGSDGETYKQLFKGEGDDDLRQDAVMEQVFELCNQVLSKDQETRRRDLSIRTYKVIPLAAQAGILEFVGKTRPLQWVVQAHERYRPNDISSREFSSKLKQTREQLEIRRCSPADLKSALISMFDSMRRKFRPVMRHFFTEHRKDPQAWFEMRLAYSRSVAVTSIVGHILGLGDRHLSNILIDTGTGEVVHIDLGIAFEQGKLLPIPERVPFRLTADMVDGFGTAGTEGVFRRCAEETLRVLREGSGVIKTVLEVFKYDPLHSWTASAVKIRKAQGPDAPPASPLTSMASSSANAGLAGLAGFGMGMGGMDLPDSSEAEAADRALRSVAHKLDKSLSVEYTVNELTSEASDVSNLALMFVGWAPHC